jgi:DNA topoisomerase IA
LKLVIAEKPNVAQNIAAALGVKNKKDGYIEAAAISFHGVSGIWWRNMASSKEYLDFILGIPIDKTENWIYYKSIK